MEGKEAEKAQGRGGWPRRSGALQRLGDWAMKKVGSAVVAMVLVGSVGWAEDEDSDTVVNAISGGSGVNYKVGLRD